MYVNIQGGRGVLHRRLSIPDVIHVQDMHIRYRDCFRIAATFHYTSRLVLSTLEDIEHTDIHDEMYICF